MMSSKVERFEFLRLTEPPARFNSEQTAWQLGMELHDIPILMQAGLLKPLGEPAKNAPKYFDGVVIMGYRHDHAWLDKASKAVTRHWQKKNSYARNVIPIAEGRSQVTPRRLG